MAKCVICKKNLAVVFTTRFENGSRVSEGLCLKCAYKTGLGGMDELFSKAGITDANIDELTERMNQVMSQVDGQSPENLFQSLLSGNFDLSAISSNFDPELSDGDDSTEKSSELQPASVGQDSDEISDRRSPSREGDPAPSPRPEKKRKFLDQFGTNLTSKAHDGRIDRIIGRDKELARVVQILNRRAKNNPVLLGEPGVGKTAIAEGLAVKIAQREVPVKLLHQEVYLLDMTAMVAGTQFRGQFESRMKGVVDEARKAGNIILVIDELHNIMGAGDAEGAMNAANILKPALAKGEIRVLGSTTLDEYRRFIEKDSALERRFQKVIVEEPSPAESVEILKGVRDYYEVHHHVTYSDEVVELAVRMADRYITDRFLPDKAIDLLDEAGSHCNLHNEVIVKIDDDRRTLTALKRDQEALENQIANSPEDVSFYEKEADLRSKVLRLEDELQKLEAEAKPTEITTEDIARVVEMWTGIPVQRINESETEKLVKLEDRLHQRVIGQQQAVSALARAIRRNRAGFGKKRKPASFIFVGPTGVGKTELVKALAEALFETEDAMVRLDMSEFMEPHTVSKLIGSPPGYVGYDDGGQLTEKIRRKPYSVILLDEIEKAHADVFNILLQILDDGRLTDSHGRLVSFENTVIVMTSNAGTTLKANAFGFGADGYVALESRVQSVLKEMFRPEFLNRVDEIVVFSELNKAEIRRIVDLMLKEVTGHLQEKGLQFVVTDAAKDYLAEKGYDPKYGARPLRKTIQRLLEDPLADLVLAGHLKNASGVSADYKDGTIKLDWI
ncbi:MAG: ATP-dependent Clp protease ATP-binding subunit [Clostridia bacterium]|nr:ATP-dependent Clp protease ATP-binding subunit [Clostridia bacterium]NCC75707.1 ATP-dependent Clp protease ATP-binding subunit [Clostridia bacterium]